MLSLLAGEPGWPLLLLGPSLGTGAARLWGAVAARLPGFQVVGWDLPGHGRSPAVGPVAESFSLAGLAAAVLQAVDLEYGPGKPFSYAGDSIGGAVGLQLALDRPDRIEALAVLCSAARFSEPDTWHGRAGQVRKHGTAELLEASDARWFGSAIRSAGDQRRGLALADLAAVDDESYARLCEALAGFDLRNRLGAIRAPVLAVAGAEDAATPPAELAAIADGVPAGQLSVLDGVGHLAPYEDPVRVSSLLAGFFGRNGSGAEPDPARRRRLRR